MADTPARRPAALGRTRHALGRTAGGAPPFAGAGQSAASSQRAGPRGRGARSRAALDLPERRRLPPLLRRAWYGLNQSFRRFTAQAGITPDQFTVLRMLREHGPLQLTQRELAERMSSDPNTIASLLRRMERQGLVQRHTPAEDRRAYCLALEPAGDRKYRQVRRRALALQRRILAALPEAAREGFLAQLEIVANVCWQTAQTGRTGATPTGPPPKE